MKLTKLVIVLQILTPITVLGTAQAGDILLYKGDTLSLFSNPLEQYFEQKNERTINGQKLTFTSTACWRGYQATWKIENDSLFLVKIQKGCSYDGGVNFDIKKEFGTNVVFASWYSGGIKAPHGERILYIHSGYESIYEKEYYFTFDKGKVLKHQEYDNSKSFKSIYSKDWNALNSYVYSSLNWDIIPDLKDSSVNVKIAIISTGSRSVDSAFVVKGSGVKVLDDEVLRAVKTLPEWDVYYKGGEVYHLSWVIPIILDEKKRKKYSK